MKTQIVVVRHCQATGNLNKTFQGSIDADITPFGLEQLHKLSQRFSTLYDEYKNIGLMPITKFYSSPLIRAKKTALEVMNNPIFNNCDLTLYIDENLREINAGDIEGTSWLTFAEDFPYEADCWYNHEQDFAPPNGETMRQVYDRIYKCVVKIAKKNKGKAILCASHGCAIHNLVCRCKGLPIEKLGEVVLCRNTAITVIEFDDNFNPTVLIENDYKHLGEVEPSLEQKLKA